MLRVVHREVTRFSRFFIAATAGSFLTLAAVTWIAGVTTAVSRAGDPLPRSVLILDQSDPHSTWYADRLFGVVIFQGAAALDFVLRSRGELWPGAPVVFAGVDEVTGKRSNYPSDVTGTLYHLPFHNSATAARALVPNLKRIALVGNPWDHQAVRRHYKEEIPAFSSELEFIDLLGLPMAESRERVASLPSDTAIIYTSVTFDGAGTTYAPHEGLAAFADAARRPIIIDVVGHGGTAGFVATPALAGQAAAQLAMRILTRENASNIPITRSDFTRPVSDWRQLQRFGISESRLPPRSEIRFQPLSLWDQYRWHTIVILSALLLQATMIGWLLFEHRRRQTLEVELRRRLLEVIHLNRSATAGALSASVADELTQPLGAIQSSAEAAALYLNANPPNLSRVGQLLANIRRDDQRAAAIIRHLRQLLKKKDTNELQEFDVNEVITDALDILRPEALKRGVTLYGQRTRPLIVHADRVQLQQVILNLAINGMDAMQNCAPGYGRISIRAAAIGECAIEVSVTDSGTGIPRDKLSEVFNTFYTTKRHGTGLGLSIARTIVETYGGRIWAENRAGGGAVFRFTLPLSKVITHDGLVAGYSHR